MLDEKKQPQRIFRQLFIGIACLVFLCTAAMASIEEEIGNIYDNLKQSTTTTKAGVYKGQSAGYYTGGGFSMRSGVRNLQIAEIRLPGYRAGCGGIDFFTGGMSFINANELKKFAKNIMNNAVGYSFSLAMETLCPSCVGNMKYYMNLANKVNQANLNSCEQAEALVDGVYGKLKANQRKLCEDEALDTDAAKDRAQARQMCGNGGEMQSTLDSAKEKPGYRDQVLQNTNLAWKALRKNTFLSNDTALAELLMSLSGTVVVRSIAPQKEAQADTDKKKKDNTLSFNYFPSLAKDKELLNALLEGGKAKIYRCGYNKETKKDTPENPNEQGDYNTCLTLHEGTIEIDKKDALIPKIRATLNSILQKLRSESKESQVVTDKDHKGPLTQEEEDFLSGSTLPVLKYIVVQAAFHGENASIKVDDYARIIANDLLLKHLNNSLLFVKNSLRNVTFSTSVADQYMAGIDGAIRQIHQSAKDLYSSETLTMQLNKRSQQIERMLMNRMSSNMFDTFTWIPSLG